MNTTAFRFLMFGALWTLSSACGSNQEIRNCIEGRTTIQRGVYGQLLNGCDTEDCTVSYAVGMELRVYDANPTSAAGPQYQGIYDSGTTLAPIKRTTSGTEGFYEIALTPGTYYLCTNSCAQVVLSAAEPRIRRDWASGPGGGNWWTGACTQ